MWIERCALVWMFVLAGSPAAQEMGPLRIEGAVAVFAQRFADCQRSVSTTTTTHGEDRAHALLGCLRLGRIDAARDRLDEDPPDGAAICWAVIAHHWYLHASGDTATVQVHLPKLCAALDRVGAASEPAATFEAAALLPHAWFCLGDLLDTCAEAGSGSASSRRGLDLWLELERQVWQPGRGHFRPHPTRGEVLLPEPPDATVLAPAAAGLLIASTDHMERHLRTSLQTLLRRPPTDLRAATRLLCGAAQLGNDDLLVLAWQALLAIDDGGAKSAGEAGRQLDAMLFAITGLRLATGAGVDPRCVRWRPWLPPGADHLVLHNLAADGARFDLDLTTRHGELQPDERDEGALSGTRIGRRLRVQLTLVAAATGSHRTILLAGRGVQYIAHLRAGDRLSRSLPLDGR